MKILIYDLLTERDREGRRDMVQTISGHSRCGVGARASHHSAEMMICARTATVGEAVRMQWRSWRRSAVVVEVLPVTWLRTLSGSELGFVGGESGLANLVL
jgi:hypothetical protein